VDVGTGSGAIAVALACYTPPTVSIGAGDIAPAALAVAQTNARRHGVADRIAWFCGDLLEPLTTTVDLILANLPYVASTERERLMPEVRDFEPPEALFAGADGLSLIERLLAQAPSRLQPGGALLLEIGYGQGEAVLALARAAFPHARLTLHPDLAGIERVLQIET
jgi:release factor glutamine methyltransferase